MILKKGTLKYQLLQAMAFVGDAGLEFFMNEVLVTGKLRMPGRKKYSSQHFERVLKEFTSIGFIDRVQKGGTSYIRLRPQANIKIARHIPLPSLQKIKWDGYFRCLAYDFPKEMKYKRDLLRKQIKKWGMGKFQYSLYITPHSLEDPIEEFIKARGLDNFAYLFVTRRKLSKEKGQEIAEKVWEISRLEEEYWEFIGKWKDKLFDKTIKKSDLEMLRFGYFSLLEKDPHLPFDLLEAEWPALEARDIYLTIEEEIKNKREVLQQ